MLYYVEWLFLISLFLLLSRVYVLGKMGVRDLKGQDGLPKGDEMSPFLFLNLFYVNPNDPRGWLLKQKAWTGWTVNFRSKANAWVFLGLLLLVLLSTFLLVVGLASAK